MATDFFQQQDRARQRTARLLYLFSLAMLTLVGLVYLLCVLIFNFWLDIPGPIHSLWHPWLLLGVAVSVFLVVGGGAAVQTAQLNAGGKAVALMLGGRQVSPDSRDFHEKRLLNVVEEMALASGVPVPAVYVMRNEDGINAFAAGHAPGDAVVAVSQGCLDYLSRDELQGVVAHEFSHILNGDMRLNLRMIALLHGLVALALVGRFVLEYAWYSDRGSSRRSSDSKDDDKLGLALVVLGVGVMVLGLIGVLVSDIIKAAVSRQREFLADASAVQFTRNPDGIAGALKKIGGLARGGLIKNARAIEASHMFFAGSRAFDVFATHPPLEERIRRLDPHWDGTFPRPRRLRDQPDEEVITEAAAEPATARPARAATALPGVAGFPNPLLGAAVLAQAGQGGGGGGGGGPDQFARAAALNADLPAVLRDAAHEPFSARALVYALLLDPRPEVYAAQMERLKAGAEPRDYEETARLAAAVVNLPDGARLPLVDLALPALRQLSPRQYQTFRDQIDRLQGAEQQPSLFEYALRCVLRRHLDAVFHREKPPAVRYKTAFKVAPQLGTMLSLLAWEGQDTEDAARRAFEIGMKAYLNGELGPYRLLPRSECTLQAFDQALQTFMEALPAIRRQALQACAACVMADGKIVPREAELLRAIASTLNIPVPPLPTTAA
jgi:Zn-dependent protease with chaperone function